MNRITNKISKIAILSTSILFSFAVFAEPSIKTKAYYEFQTAVGKNNGNSLQRKITEQNKDVGFNSTARLQVEFLNSYENLFDYGAKISAQTTTRNTRSVPSFIYLISDFGKLELGSDRSAYAKMKITNYSIACATGGAFDVFVNQFPADKTKVNYFPNYSNFLDGKTRKAPNVEYSRKVSYFTPKMLGFEFGVSYIPDSSNVGYQGHDAAEYFEIAKPSTTKFVLKNAVGYGASHELKLENASIKTAVVAENANIKAFTSDDKPSPIKFSKVQTYTVGTEINVDNYAVAASYMDYGKSLTSELDKISKKTYVWGLAGRYKYDRFAVSLSYFASNNKKSKLDAIVLGSDFKIASGLMTYAEFSSYKTNGQYLTGTTTTKEKLRGNMFIWGIKVEV